jgi:hypothetical protein
MDGKVGPWFDSASPNTTFMLYTGEAHVDECFVKRSDLA